MPAFISHSCGASAVYYSGARDKSKFMSGKLTDVSLSSAPQSLLQSFLGVTELHIMYVSVFREGRLNFDDSSCEFTLAIGVRE